MSSVIVYYIRSRNLADEGNNSKTVMPHEENSAQILARILKMRKRERCHVDRMLTGRLPREFDFCFLNKSTWEHQQGIRHCTPQQMSPLSELFTSVPHSIATVLLAQPIMGMSSWLKLAVGRNQSRMQGCHCTDACGLGTHVYWLRRTDERQSG
jgi:hypothetical protein